MATAQIGYQTGSVQDSLPAAKKRKRGAAVAEDVAAVKEDVNGSAGTENGTQDANQFSEANTHANGPFPGQGQDTPDENAVMAAALQAHGQQMSNYSSGIQQGGFEMGSPTQTNSQQYIDSQFTSHAGQGSDQGALASPTGASGINKPPVGSDEWHRIRRDNHKEVERRRRETINEGINELAKIVPGNEKNKGSILARTVTYIRELQSTQQSSAEHRSLERQLLEQAVDELSHNNEGLKQRNVDVEHDRDYWRSSVVRMLAKMREHGISLQEEEEAGIVAKVEQIGNH